MDRRELLLFCAKRQRNICPVCGHGIYISEGPYGIEGYADLHEVIIKRGDLPKDNRIFSEYNCVAIHHGSPCHENTRHVDERCMSYLVRYYGVERIFRWIVSLEMYRLPGRALDIQSEVNKSDLANE